MACENCTQKAIELNAKQNEIINEAKKKANETGEWVGIYTEDGETKYAVGQNTVGKPIKQYITPG